MTGRDRLTSSAHVKRADEHANHAAALVSNEWAAVCYFYAAYHRLRAALLDDPIFDDVTQLHSLHLDLTPDDRYATAHKGRGGRGNRDYGVNDLVYILYRFIAGPYDKLHTASCEVRYDMRLRAQVADLSTLYATIKSEHEAGKLVAWSEQ